MRTFTDHSFSQFKMTRNHFVLLSFINEFEGETFSKYE